MDARSELKIEYQRLLRHVNFLEKRYNTSVARDLAACLRNWVQMSDAIVDLIAQQDWNVKFSKHSSSRALKKLRSGSSGISAPLPGSAKSKGIKIAGVAVFNKALSPEEVKRMYEIEKSSRPSVQEMSFKDWLNSYVYQVQIEGKSRDISRKTFIDRSANLLGGTHPMTNFVESEHTTWADPYIVDSLSTQVGPWPLPYSILMESAQEILRSFKPYL